MAREMKNNDIPVYRRRTSQKFTQVLPKTRATRAKHLDGRYADGGWSNSVYARKMFTTEHTFNQ